MNTVFILLNHCGRLLHFWPLRVGVYSRGMICLRLGTLLNFHHFHKVVSLLCQKKIIIKKINKNKLQSCTKVDFKHNITVETLNKISDDSHRMSDNEFKRL